MTAPRAGLRHLCLVGLMGSGKSTVGRLVADRLGWPLSDSDAAIEATEGRTGREIARRDGVEVLHALERRHLERALAAPGPSVICPAASVIDDKACREALRDPSILVVWLTASPATAAARYDDQAHRPAFGTDPEAFLAAQVAERRPRFRSVGPVELATDDRSPEELAGVIVGLAGARGGAPGASGAGPGARPAEAS